MLGQLGRLGNQLFQYASTLGISENNKLNFAIPSNSDLYNFFEMPKTSSWFNFKKIKVRDEIGFDEEIFNNCPDNIDLLGYLQSEKYFKNVENKVRNNLTFKPSVIKQVESFFIKNCLIDTEKISLHIRRTDYLTDVNFVQLDLNYYLKALNYFDNLPVIVFSDDPEWCSNQDIFKNKRYVISNLNSSVLDLCAMTFCQYHIIANSSFSWWGSWLAKSKKTVAPKQWYSGNLNSWSTNNLYLNDWIIV